MRIRGLNSGIMIAGIAVLTLFGSCNDEAFNNKKTPAGQDASPGRTEENEYQPENPTNNDTVRIDQDNSHTGTP